MNSTSGTNAQPEIVDSEQTQSAMPQPLSLEEQSHINELKQKVADLKFELQMSPKQFEDKLLHKLREEINVSKRKMQSQMEDELVNERQRL